MKKLVFTFAAALLCVMGIVLLAQPPQQQPMSFFVTSVGSGDGANLSGIGGADYHCQRLAEAAGSTKTFQAYLSLRSGSNGTVVVNARDRIGTGPWYNAKGARIAQNVADLHSDNNLNKQTALTEKGTMINGAGDNPNMHDILTGSKPDGTAYSITDGVDHTCNNWTSKGMGSAQLGHHDRTGGGFTSWNSAHASRGCSQANLAGTGGTGLFYCFAID